MLITNNHHRVINLLMLPLMPVVLNNRWCQITITLPHRISPSRRIFLVIKKPRPVLKLKRAQFATHILQFYSLIALLSFLLFFFTFFLLLLELLTFLLLVRLESEWHFIKYKINLNFIMICFYIMIFKYDILYFN